MIESGAATVKRIYAKAQKLFHAPNKACEFDFKKTGATISASVAQTHFTAEDIYLLNSLREQLSEELQCEEPLTDRDILYLALEELQFALRSSRREDEVLGLQFQLWQDKILKNDRSPF